MQDIITFISNHSLLSLSTALILILLFIIEAIRTKRASAQLSPAKTTQIINHDNGVVIDIRPSESYRKGHIIDSYSYRAKDIQDNVKKVDKFKAKPIIIVCQTGIESQKIAAFLAKQGYNAYSLAGGIRAWISADMPLMKS